MARDVDDSENREVERPRDWIPFYLINVSGVLFVCSENYACSVSILDFNI